MMLSAFTQATDENFLGREVLANNRTLHHYRGVTIVEDPNINIENEEERLALLAELRAQDRPSVGVDLDTVNERLQGLSKGDLDFRPRSPSEASTVDAPTPLEGEALVQFYKDEEVRCRQELIEFGCPPCHPPDYTFPYDTENRWPNEHPAAMFYILNERNGHIVIPLADQLRGWKGFRFYQKQVRKDLQNDSKHRTPEHMLKEYMLDGQYYLKRRGFYESASLVDWSLDISKQPFIQDWLEYLVSEIDYRRTMKSRAARNIRGAYDEADRQWHQKYEERRIAAHEAMLVWMDEQRVLMSAAEKSTQSATTKEQPTSDEGSAGKGRVSGPAADE